MLIDIYNKVINIDKICSIEFILNVFKINFEGSDSIEIPSWYYDEFRSKYAKKTGDVLEDRYDWRDINSLQFDKSNKPKKVWIVTTHDNLRKYVLDDYTNSYLPVSCSVSFNESLMNGKYWRSLN